MHMQPSVDQKFKFLSGVYAQADAVIGGVALLNEMYEESAKQNIVMKQNVIHGHDHTPTFYAGYNTIVFE